MINALTPPLDIQSPPVPTRTNIFQQYPLFKQLQRNPHLRHSSTVASLARSAAPSRSPSALCSSWPASCESQSQLHSAQAPECGGKEGRREELLAFVQAASRAVPSLLIRTGAFCKERADSAEHDIQKERASYPNPERSSEKLGCLPIGPVARPKSETRAFISSRHCLSCSGSCSQKVFNRSRCLRTRKLPWDSISEIL